MMSKSRSNFEIAITPLIFELERRSQAQNVGNLTGYCFVTLNFRLDFRLKTQPDLAMAAILKISKYFR